ncbi:MAG: hypothetical protein M1831_005320 [Alyxoria varia]|nr:MAG: hypothetical protein M1831_005320 [Alyxoria varia]
MANEANDLNAPAKSTDGIPFWNVNIPKEEWTDHCPDYLSQVDHYDQAQLAVKDDEYQAMSWQEVKVIVRETNRLELFKRYPSELRKYRVYVQKIKDEYGSVMNFILKQRLRWQDLNPKGSPFQYKEDICILFNDWPYGVDRRISHLVVWTKFIFAEDPSTGDLTAKARKEIQDFVDATFHDQTKKDQVRFDGVSGSVEIFWD